MPADNNPFAAKIRAMEGVSVPAPRTYSRSQAAPVDTAPSEAQLSFIAALLKDRDWESTLSADYGRRILEIEVGAGKPLTKAGASVLITTLKECPLRPGPKVSTEFPNVPAGRYAVATEEGALNELAFYKVDRPEEGRWAGFIFVKLMQSDEEVRLAKDTQKAILAKISQDPEGAMAAYGHHIGECGMCGRALTNDESRARGIGPKCAAKAGW